MKNLFFIILSVMFSFPVLAQNDRKLIREGNKQYSENKYSDAEVLYRKALSQKSNSFEASFNTADALYKQGKFTDAAAIYDTLAASGASKSGLAKSYYNLGNSLVKAQKIQDGINAYKKSLRLSPNDNDAKVNLSYAYKLLKKQQDQQKKDNKDNKNQDKNKDQNKNNKDQNKNNKDQNKDNKDQNKNNQDNKDQNKNQDQQKQNQDQKGGGKQEISRQAAEQMLQAIQNDEKNVQQRLQEQKNKNAQQAPVSKNW